MSRAEVALANGRSDQARSDVATAHSLVGSVDAGRPDENWALAELQARMADIEARLGRAGG